MTDQEMRLPFFDTPTKALLTALVLVLIAFFVGVVPKFYVLEERRERLQRAVAAECIAATQGKTSAECFMFASSVGDAYVSAGASSALRKMLDEKYDLKREH